MKTLKQARDAFNVIDAWFDSPLRAKRTQQQLDQIRGAHFALAWFFGKPLRACLLKSHGRRSGLTADFDENIESLRQELAAPAKVVRP